MVVGHINPNRVALLKKLANTYPQLELISSNPGAKLLRELWGQRKPATPNSNQQEESSLPSLPSIEIVRQEQKLSLSNEHELWLLPAPTARWPGGLLAFEESLGLLMSDKLFAAHLCTSEWAEANRISTEEERRHFYDCLMAPMASQVDTLVERLEELDIRTIAPCHGPAIETSWRSLLDDCAASVGADLERLQPSAVVVELPSNPLLRCIDLPTIARLAHRQGIPVIADDTIGSGVNIDGLPHADLVFSSLTKSFAGRGDVLAGSLVLSPHTPWRDQLAPCNHWLSLPTWMSSPLTRAVKTWSNECISSIATRCSWLITCAITLPWRRCSIRVNARTSRLCSGRVQAMAVCCPLN